VNDRTIAGVTEGSAPADEGNDNDDEVLDNKGSGNKDDEPANKGSNNGKEGLKAELHAVSLPAKEEDYDVTHDMHNEDVDPIIAEDKEHEDKEQENNSIENAGVSDNSIEKTGVGEASRVREASPPENTGAGQNKGTGAEEQADSEPPSEDNTIRKGKGLQIFDEPWHNGSEWVYDPDNPCHNDNFLGVTNKMQQEWLALRDQLQQERSESQWQHAQSSRLLEDQEAQTTAAENEKHLVVPKLKSSHLQLHQQQGRPVQMAGDKRAHTMAKVDKREDEVCLLKVLLKELTATMTEHQNSMEEAEEEIDELHSTNEILRQNLHKVEAERDKLTKQPKLFKSQKTK
jgi:hypothetical protein